MRYPGGLINCLSTTEPGPPSRSIAPRGRTRFGVSSIPVLGVSLLVATMGFTALLVVRGQSRMSMIQGDAAEARLLALSAIDLARLEIDSDPNWRTTYAGATWGNERAVAPGKFYAWKVVDYATGGSVTTDELASVRVVGKGRVGSGIQLQSVVLTAKITPLDVLRTTVHSNDNLHAGAPITTTGGPVSTNALLLRLATIIGKAEAASTLGWADVTGGLTCPAPLKTMPDPSVFDIYRNMATQLLWGGGAEDWTITWPLLSAGINPSGGSTNADGIYFISVPAGKTLILEMSRIKGSLVVECGDAASVRLREPVCWEPHRTDLPILLVKHLTNSLVDDRIEAGAGSIVETSVGANLNPPHTPYNGVSNSIIAATDTYPSQLKGLIHVISPPPNIHGSRTRIGNGVTIIGTLVTDQRVRTVDDGTSNLTFSPTLYAAPPKGYYTVDMIPSPGSWRQEALP